VKILTICYGGSEIAVSFKIITISLLLIITCQVRAEESPIAMPEINEDMLRQSREILNSVQKVRTSPKYQGYKKWIGKNNQKFFARQTEKLPTIDYDITKKQLEKDAIATLLNKYRFKPDEINKSQITHFPLMIFVSSSIPKSSLKGLMIQAKKSGAVLVFRGIMGTLSNTAKFLGDISKNNVQAIIDPRLFDLFNIQAVPTIVVLKGANQDCGSGNCKTTPIHDQISGNITLDYALETIANGKSEASSIAAKFLAKLREGGIHEN
jgi:type-F conjugative transfer system pilin assembly protein TrbC